MPQRARLSKTSLTSAVSPSKSKKNSIPIRKGIRKKPSPTKRHVEQTSSILTQPRQKRLSSLTAATLLQYCTSILSPSRKLNRSTKTISKNTKPIKQSSDQKQPISNVSSRSENKPVQMETSIPVRSRREASSRASAMIMQQNEIERSRYSYSLTTKQSTSVIRRQRTKSTSLSKDDPSPEEKVPVKSTPSNNLPRPTPIPSITDVSNQEKHTQSSTVLTVKSTHPISISSKYPSLTEAILAEHDRLHENLPSTHTTKQDNLIKWTQELALCGRLSPPCSDQIISLESIQTDLSTQDNKSTTSITYSNTKQILAPPSESSQSIANNVTTTPSFLFPSAGYPLDLRSFYPLLPCWQYPAWSYQSSTSLLEQIQPSKSATITRHRTSTDPERKTIKKSITSNSKQRAIVPIRKQKQDLFLSSEKKEALTFHLHTHHHHHIHNSNASSLLKPSNLTKTTTAVPISPEKTSNLINKEQQFVEPKSILPLSVNKIIKEEQQSISPIADDGILNLSINNKTKRRKSIPVKRPIRTRTKSNSSSAPSIHEPIPPLTVTSSPRKSIDHNQVLTALPVSNNLNSNGRSSIGDQRSPRRVLKRRSVSAATARSTITTVSQTGKSSRGKRTTSASCIPIRSKSTISRKRSHSPVSISLPLTNKRKKQKVSHHWILFGKSEQKLVSVHADKPPVFRDCYSSIQHITEKDIIKSNDCVILRPDTGPRHGATPYLAKVKWFWQEPTSDEIQMSLIWYYHPEHTELPTRIKERFLPNELLASKYWDCVNVACIEDKCYVLNLNEYNRYCLREKSTHLFEHSESVGQLKSLLNKDTSSIYHRPLPGKTVDNQNIFFSRHVYDYRVKRILKNPSLTSPVLGPTTVTTA